MSKRTILIPFIVLVAIGLYLGTSFLIGTKARDQLLAMAAQFPDKFRIEAYDRGVLSSRFQLILMVPASINNGFVDQAFHETTPSRWVVPVRVSHGPFTSGRLAAASLEATLSIPGVSPAQYRLGIVGAWLLESRAVVGFDKSISATVTADPVTWQVETGRGEIRLGELDATISLDPATRRLAGQMSFGGIEGRGPSGQFALGKTEARWDAQPLRLPWFWLGDAGLSIDTLEFRNADRQVVIRELALSQQSTPDSLSLTLGMGDSSYSDPGRDVVTQPSEITLGANPIDLQALAVLPSILANRPGGDVLGDPQSRTALFAIADKGLSVSLSPWELVSNKGRITAEGSLELAAPGAASTPEDRARQATGASSIVIDRALAIWLAEEISLAASNSSRDEVPPKTLRTLAEVRIKAFVDTGRVRDTGVDLIIDQRLEDGILYWSGSPFFDLVDQMNRPAEDRLDPMLQRGADR